MLRSSALVKLLLLAFALVVSGCGHYRESTRYWQADEHAPVRQILEVPLSILTVPMIAIAGAIYPFELDKERASVVELAAVGAILVDPTRTLAEPRY